MQISHPETPEQLAEVLRDAADADRTIRLGGAFTKDSMAGPIAPADVCISTGRMTRVLQYDPADLTVSVEAGLPWSELTRMLAANRQMVPLDPPFSHGATVGGVMAANTSGPRRRLYGTARDVVIGMHFATLEGKLVQTGGMVVKNVAGLDMAKLMIGSFGTLAAVAVVNLKLTPMPEATRTFLLSRSTADEAMEARNRLLASVLQPTAVDVLNDKASARLGLAGFVLAVQAAGVPEVLSRYGTELNGAATLEGAEESAFWERVREFTPSWLAENSGGIVRRVSTTIDAVGDVLKAQVPVVSRAANGVSYVYGEGPEGVVEHAPAGYKAERVLWPNPGSDFGVMQKIKALFDPKNLLNRGRLYGRI